MGQINTENTPFNMNDNRNFNLALEQHTAEEIERYEELRRDIRELKATVESLVNIWNQARGAITIIKWIAAISGSLGAFILFIKDHVK